MKKVHHTVIVIGAGPAGSSASYTLARHGVDVCLVDKSVFPRDKLCGGLLTLRSKKIFSQIFDASWSRVIDHTSHGVKFFYKNNLLNSVENYSELFFTQRYKFDEYLLGMAESKGALTSLGDGVSSIDLSNKICRLRSGKELTYDYLFGADGVNSIVAKTMFGSSFNKKTIAFALEMEVERSEVERIVIDPEIYFGITSWGYGWVFPKKNTLTVGIGGIYGKNKNIKDMFTKFLIQLLGKVPKGKIKGHYIPFGDYKKIPGANDVLLVGDAAGLVEPITGEGIAFAMQSGYYAGLSVIERLNHKREKNVLDIYKEKYSEITSILNHANILRYLIFPKLSEHLFIKTLPRIRQLPLKHLDLMADDMKYEEYVRYLIKKALKGIFNQAAFKK